MDIGSFSLYHPQMIDHWFYKINSLIEDTVTPILQAHHVAITNLLNTVGFSSPSNGLPSGGVVLTLSGGVQSIDLPNDT